MKTLISPLEAADSFVKENMRHEVLRKIFLKKPREGKISFLHVHLIGSETERFSPEPVYSVTGKGFLRSKGVQGLLDERELENFLRGKEGRAYVDEFLLSVNERIKELE